MNQEIRRLIFEHNLKLWQVADVLGIHPVTLSNWLRHELPEDKRARVLEAIKTIVAERDNH